MTILKILTFLRRLFVLFTIPVTVIFLAYIGYILGYEAIHDPTTVGKIVFGGLSLDAFLCIGVMCYLGVQWWAPMESIDLPFTPPVR